MTIFGFHASHEQIAPSRLLADVQLAEIAGFDAAMCSDHFAPWSSRQGQAGFTWSWLGAAMASTNLSFGTVSAPGMRYHPAILAQASATLTEMFPGRFWMCLGTGQWMNEHIAGERWPSKDERDARLMECVDIVRRLHRGETVTHRGLVTVENAKLWTLPAEPPLLFQPTLSEGSAARGATWADGIVTINQPPERLRRIVDAYRDAGGDGELVLQVHVSWAPTSEEAWAIARDQWSSNVWSTVTATDVTTAHLEDVSRGATDEMIGRACLVDHDLGGLTARIRELVDLGGFDRVYLHHVGQEQRPWIEAAGEHVLPDLR
ncbi:TIGR03885 family FMN-dependent LLM class oxidoreductase [Mobilicoccus pelagius]|uniref:Putative oxidoreductase n=1 Tax=Mobilicoccus pelagius NBRC 104925 TaxID=1089455 RepID=H5UTP4_9MICO|nr:TIGR03885 family FMN-dependent LLM class oxidoreductase [Mobilicoccus pelagius]GAB49102.1 putative oxidoreductase [Mobilicoccus pelagius NBRC 104925]